MNNTIIVYGKHNLTYNSNLLRNLYFIQCVDRIKLNGGRYYDIFYSQAQNTVYAVVSRVQYDEE